MKLIVIGGHMAPALGFIDSLPKETEVVYVGRKHVFEGDAGESLEASVIKKRGIPFVSLSTGRMQRVLTKHTFSSLLKVPQGFFEAVGILRKEKPDAVVAFGGYLAVPVGFAAKLLGIPLVIHESTRAAGMANKILSPFAKKICLSWESSRAYFPKEKIVMTGNPLLPFDRYIDASLLPKSKEKLPLFMVTGGSGGSHAINEIVLSILPELLEKGKVIHQTGDAQKFGDYAKLVEAKKSLPKEKQDRYVVMKYIDPESINSVFAKADVIIGRSGVNTTMACLLLHKKSILIPLPTGQKNEQLENALIVESEGLGIILDQKTVSPKKLFEAIHMLLNKKRIPSKWNVPVISNGGKNLVREVMTCLKMHEE